MKSKALSGIVLLGLVLLSACGQDTATPGATSTVTAVATIPPTVEMQSTPGVPATQEPPTAPATLAPTEAPTQAATIEAQPTQPPSTTTAAPTVGTPGQSATGSEPPKLGPVTVETGNAPQEGAFSEQRTLNLPPGFHIKLYSAGVSGVRWLGLAPDGLLYATSPSSGKVFTLPDANNDGVADSIKPFADGLRGVHGIAFKDGAVYVATETEIVRLEDTNKDGVADKRDVLASDLPGGGGHSTRTLAFSADGTKLFVSAGSSCNVCPETDPKRAAISLYSPDGKFQKVYARGLRNAVGLLIHPVTGDLWATNNGRDQLGDDIPPETVYDVKEDTDYGWPFCYGDRVPDKEMNPPAGYCEKTGVPAVEMQAHSAPLGLAFYTGKTFPQSYNGDLFVAFHGSWNRTVPTGFKLVRIKMKDNQPDISLGDNMVQDFATGWHIGADAWGRPVDPLVAPNGNLLLTDDKAGAIYSIYYAGDATP